MFQGHPSWRAILGFYLKGLLGRVIAFLRRSGDQHRNGDTDTALVILIAVVGVAGVVLAGFIKRSPTTTRSPPAASTSSGGSSRATSRRRAWSGSRT